jgi:DNA ligase-1
VVDKELDIILDIMSKSGTNEKIDTIKQNEDNERLKQILFYTFNPLYVFGISSKKIEKELNMILPFETDDLLELLEYLKEHHTGSDMDIAVVQNFISKQDEKYKSVLTDIVTKSLTLGINAKSINKVWDNFIPDYEVQQGERLENNIDKLMESGKQIIVTQKYFRCSLRALSLPLYFPLYA